MGTPEQIVLGLDVGVASVGWALIRFVQSTPGGRFDRPVGLIDTGVRRFETGTDGKKAGEAGITQGRDESRAKSRRVARGQRRQIDRRSQRIANTVRHLQSGGLLPHAPPGAGGRGDSRHHYIHALDANLLSRTLQRLLRREPSVDARVAAQIVATRFPYLLRSAGLDEPLTPHELGRVFLHLAQRRGYQSNRKEANKLALAEQEESEKRSAKKAAKRAATAADDDVKGTLADIESLRQKITSAGAATLGAYLATLDPHEQRIRTLRTARDMFTAEFDQIVAAQAAHHPILRDEKFTRRLRHALFFQRPLRSARALRNRCELMPPRRCIARASLAFQRYRMVTEVNNLRVLDATGEIRAMSSVERLALYNALGNVRHLTLIQARQAALPKGSRWTIELDKDLAKGKRLPGEGLAAALQRAAPLWWPGAAPKEREALASALRGAETSEALLAALKGPPWDFDSDTAKALAAIPLEESYGAYSGAAIAALLPNLEGGMTLPQAIKTAFPTSVMMTALDLLPPVKGRDKNNSTLRQDDKDAAANPSLGDVRNPAVMRSLTELRKVVNHIVRKHGKPDLIRVELARDLKRGRQERKAIFRSNLDREASYRKFGDEAREKVPSLGLGPLVRRDRVKWALAVECGWMCPYTGACFEPHDLFSGRVEIEHIIPRSQHGDDSFSNLTLCLGEENPKKNGQTPLQAYGKDASRYQEMLLRVSQFKGSAAAFKLEAFQRQDTTDEAFAMRHLNDTRYTTRLAVRYLGFLYGYIDDPTRARAIDAQGNLRVQSNTGGLTSLLRRKWQLMKVMDKLLRAHPGAPPLPSNLSTAEREELNKRVDHRHHAIDAIVVALTTPKLIEQLANVAREAEIKRLPHDRLPPIPDPWAGFEEDIETAVAKIVVSQRPDYRVNGPLHKATNYSRPITGKDQQQRTHLRVPINDPSLDPARISDKAVRAAVEEKLRDGRPDELFDLSRPETLPVIGSGAGTHPIRRVRIIEFEKSGHLKQVRSGFVQEGSNNHMAVFEREWKAGGAASKKNDAKDFGWAPCSTFEAMGRLRRGEPLVQAPSGYSVICEIRKGDYFELTDDNGRRELYVVENISENDVQLRMPQLLPGNKRDFDFGRPRLRSVGAWLRAKPKKMRVSVLGEVSDWTENGQHG